MRFTVAGKEYEISFTRERRMGERWDPELVRRYKAGPKKGKAKKDKAGHVLKGGLKLVPTSLPYTTANIYETDADGKGRKLYRTATVGCYHKEKRFDANVGRTQALRLITKTTEKPFYKAMWEAYSNRRQLGK